MLWQLDHGLRSLSKRMEQRLGVTGPQRFAVRVLGARGPLHAGALAEALQLHPSTLTGILERLERDDHIFRVTDPADARRTILFLTQKGKAIDRSNAGTIEAALKSALNDAPRTDVAASQRLLSRLVRALEQTHA